MSLTVSTLGAEVGLSAATVRSHERPGLLPAPARTAAGYRQYPQDASARLRFIKSAQRVGLRLREIAELLAICDQGLCPCGHSEALLRGRMAGLDEEEHSLERLHCWWRDLKARDAFGLPAAAEAETRLKACIEALRDYAELVYQAVHAPAERLGEASDA